MPRAASGLTVEISNVCIHQKPHDGVKFKLMNPVKAKIGNVICVKPWIMDGHVGVRPLTVEYHIGDFFGDPLTVQPYK